MMMDAARKAMKELAESPADGRAYWLTTQAAESLFGLSCAPSNLTPELSRAATRCNRSDSSRTPKDNTMP